MVWKKARQLTCDECKKNFMSKNPRKGKDGVRRCKPCVQKRMRARFKEKYGTTIYKKYARDNSKYKMTRREWSLVHYYGMTQADYSVRLDRQGGGCAICKVKPKENEHLAVDHDHSTGKVRGLLCHGCNRSLGQLKDDPATIYAAIAYLMRNDPRRGWDQYFMQIAQLVASRSKDPSTQVGAVLVREKNILSTGYNGFVRGANDAMEERYDRPVKYLWMCHAEENAVLTCARHGVCPVGATMYVTPLAPCARCASAIAQSGVKEVVIQKDQSNTRWTEEMEEGAYILKVGKVLVRYPE